MAGRGTDIQLGGNLDMQLDAARSTREAAWGRAMTKPEIETLKAELVAKIEINREKITRSRWTLCFMY